MGRHRVDDEDRRDDQLNLRLSKRERMRLQRRASALGLTLSEYVRDRGLGYRMPRLAARRQASAQAITALNKLGVNLNQVSHHLNAGWASSGTEAVLLDLMAEITTTMRGLMRDTQAHPRGQLV